MAAKGAGGASKVVGMVSALVVGSLARKVITFGWKRVTGHEPPTDPQDPDVALKEALAWSIVVGLGVEATRLIVVRIVTARMRNASADGAAGPADHRVSS